MATKQDQKKTVVSNTIQMLLDPTLDFGDKQMLLNQLSKDDSPESKKVLLELFSVLWLKPQPHAHAATVPIQCWN